MGRRKCQKVAALPHEASMSAPQSHSSLDSGPSSYRQSNKKRQCGSDKNSGQDHVASFVLLVRCCALYASASDCWTSIAGSSPVPSSPIQSHPVQPGHRYRTIIPDLLYYATVYTRLLVQVLLGPVKVVHIQWVVSCSLSYTV